MIKPEIPSFTYSSFDNNKNLFALIKSAREIQSKFRKYQIKKTKTSAKNQDLLQQINAIVEEKDKQPKRESQIKLETPSDFNGPYECSSNSKINKANSVKGNFLLKEGKFVLHKVTEEEKSLLSTSSRLDNQGNPQREFAYLKWDDESTLSSYFTFATSSPSKIKERSLDVTGFASFIDKSLGYSFKGEYIKNKPRGYGVLSFPSFLYEGEWNGRTLKGPGMERWSDGTYYQGEFDKCLKEGVGFYRWPDGTIYEGEWKKNKISGTGMIVFTDLRVYEGELLNGKMHGFGKFSWPDGKVFYGFYDNNIKNGFGIFIWNLENFRGFVGFWQNGKPEGIGLKVKNGYAQPGVWRKGVHKRWIEELEELKELLEGDQKKYYNIFSKDAEHLILWIKSLG